METLDVECLDERRIVANAKFAELLRFCGWDTVEAIMKKEAAVYRRQFPGRCTARFELVGQDGRPTAVFLKRYDETYLKASKRFLRWIGWPSARDEAWHEWKTIIKLRAQGFRTPTPVAVGASLRRGVITRSFLITEEIPNGEAGDELESYPFLLRKTLAFELGKLTRRFHECGYVHKDLYLCHFFLSRRDSEIETYIIDLQRVTTPPFFKERWLVKDLGALAFSGLKVGATSQDLLRFFKSYLGKSQLEAQDRSFAKKVMNRVAWLRTRRPKHDANFKPLNSPRTGKH